jgi:SAM-dependent methyltransferase
MTPVDDYVLGRTEAETRRLILQHQIYGPLTRRFFQTAGIGPGMKVLEVGSGAGDVALLAADLVGPQGQVIGVEMNAEIVETARARVRAAGWANTRFLVGDVKEVATGGDFDAVIGRWVLMHMTDPTGMLRELSTRVRPGGIVAFHENDFTYPPTTFPPTELDQQVGRWLVAPPGSPGGEMRMGTKLYAAFEDAGLPAPQFRLEAPLGGGPDWPGFEYVAETARSLLPMLERLTGAKPEDIGVDTLGARLRDEAIKHRAVQMLPLMFGAWTRKV